MGPRSVEIPLFIYWESCFLSADVVWTVQFAAPVAAVPVMYQAPPQSADIPAAIEAPSSDNPFGEPDVRI